MALVKINPSANNVLAFRCDYPAVLIGMWFERYLIILTSLSRDYLPSSWGMFKPTVWDFLTFFGSIGVFLFLFLLFIRLLPMISISEMRALLPGSHARAEGR